MHHIEPCKDCERLLSVAFCILEDGFVTLSKAFHLAFPNQTYKIDIALSRLLHLPLAAVRVGTPKSGKAMWFLVEYVVGVNYVSVAQFAEAIFCSVPDSKELGFDKSKVKALLQLACSDRERELIRYSVVKASGLTSKAARRHFGFEQMDKRVDRVEQCLEEVYRIRTAIEKLCNVKDEAILISMGLKDDELYVFESDGSESDESTDHEDPVCLDLPSSVSFDSLEQVLQNGNYNWFEVAEFVKKECEAQEIQKSAVDNHLNLFYSYSLKLPLNSQHKEMLTTSQATFNASLLNATELRIAALLNGDVASDSESDNAENYIGVTSLASEEAKAIITKKRKSCVRRTYRLQVKTIAAKRFLSRKISKTINSIENRFPDIGETIESYVSGCNAGADSW